MNTIITLEASYAGTVRATMPGSCRSGRDSRGTVVHLVANPEGRPLSLLGPALCGRMPRLDWSDNLASSGRVCPKCQKEFDAVHGLSQQPA